MDGLIRVINPKGALLSAFGKTQDQVITFRKEKIRSFSNIECIGISPTGNTLFLEMIVGK